MGKREVAQTKCSGGRTCAAASMPARSYEARTVPSAFMRPKQRCKCLKCHRGWVGTGLLCGLAFYTNVLVQERTGDHTIL
eukprot:1009935-Prorocentrum_minimum.AAC.2